MKITEMIEGLSIMLENMGNVEVGIGNTIDNIINRAFAICQYDLDCLDRKNKLIVPYLADKNFVLILSSNPDKKTRGFRAGGFDERTF